MLKLLGLFKQIPWWCYVIAAAVGYHFIVLNMKYDQGVSDTELKLAMAKPDTVWKHDTLRPPPIVLEGVQPKPIKYRDPAVMAIVDSLIQSGASKDSLIAAWAQEREAESTWSRIVPYQYGKLLIGGSLQQSYSPFKGFGARIELDPISFNLPEITKPLVVDKTTPWYVDGLYIIGGGLAGYGIAHIK